MIVTSAAVSTSKILSKPRRRSAAASLPSTLVPIGIPKHSPSWARTLGAGPTTTVLVGSFSAAHTFGVSSRSVRAAVGHTAVHWPQATQAVLESGISKAQAIWVSKPRSQVSITPACWFLRQTATQRRHRMHLELSRTRCGIEASVWKPWSRLEKRFISTPYSRHSCCSSQSVLREQERQSVRWVERISSRVVRR